MRMMSRLCVRAFHFFVLFAALSAGAATSYPLGDYSFPAISGSEWHYTGKDRNGAATDILAQMSATDKALICYTGRAKPAEYTRSVCALQFAYGTDSGGTFTPDDTWFEYVSTDAGIFTYWGMDDDSETYSYDRGYAIPALMTVGQKATMIRDVYMNGIYQGASTFSIQLIGVEAVVVPAGTFADCLHVRLTIDGGVLDEWWALGLGCVKRRGVSGVGAKQQRDLVSYTVQGAQTMAVRENGSGTVTPDLNGKTLVVGQQYLMTAQPVGVGVKFANWTDAANGSVVTNGPTVLFTMREGLALVANFTDLTRPAVAIKAPTLKQRIVGTNGVFTVQGTATDNAYVIEVRCKVGGGTWEKASGTNAWKSVVTLLPGENIVYAYSLDVAGNSSPTSSVACSYVSSGSLTVLKRGLGTVTRTPSDASPLVGNVYKLTATAGAGFAFQNWVDGDGFVVSTNKVFSFVMEPSLVFRANFVDIKKPSSVVIKTPLPKQRIVGTNGFFMAQGTAADNGSVALVQCMLNNGAWTNALGTNVWSLILAAAAGTNELRVCSLDADGNSSPTSSVTFTYVPTLPVFTHNGNKYQLVSADKATWAAAKTAAAASVLNGISGHLAVIETPEENQAIFAALDPTANPIIDVVMPRVAYEHPDSWARGVWIGASDSSASITGASEGNYFWVNYGVIAGQNFWGGGADGAAVSGAYSNWGGGGEPDNWTQALAKQQNHVALQIDSWVLGEAGQWNDLDGNCPQAYLIEYEDASAKLIALREEGLEAWAAFADTNTVPRGDSQWLALAAADFDLVARSRPTDYTNRIYNAVAILLNVANDASLRRQAEAYGLTDLSDLFTPVGKFQAEGAPAVNTSVDKMVEVLIPALDKAWSELNAIPATWTGRVEISPDRFSIDESVWVDIGDVTAVKAALKGVKAMIELMAAYNLNVDFERLMDPVPTPQAQIVADGSVADWVDIPCSLVSVHYPEIEDEPVTVTQKVSVALSDNKIALLITSVFLSQSGTSQLSFDLRLSETDTVNDSRTQSVDLWFEGNEVVSCGINGIYTDVIEWSLSESGNLELLMPVQDGAAVSQVTVEEVECRELWPAFNQTVFEACVPDNIPIETLRANHPECLSKVRDAIRLVAAKADLQAAMNGYLAADTLVAKRSGVNAQLLHFIDFDPSDPEAVEDREDKRSAVSQVLSSLAAPIQVEADGSIEGVSARSLFLGAFFKAPYVTTNVLPRGLTGTLSDPAWVSFENPTLNGILPGMTSVNLSKYLLGYTEVEVTTLRDMSAGTDSPYALHFWVETERRNKTIARVTVSGPGVSSVGLSQDEWSPGEWRGEVNVASMIPVKTAYTFVVEYTDGSIETLKDSIQTWLAFNPILSGSVIRWAAVAGADRYEVNSNGYRVELPVTQTSVDLSQYGLQPGYEYWLSVGVGNENGDFAYRVITYSP